MATSITTGYEPQWQTIRRNRERRAAAAAEAPHYGPTPAEQYKLPNNTPRVSPTPGMTDVGYIETLDAAGKPAYSYIDQSGKFIRDTGYKPVISDVAPPKTNILQDFLNENIHAIDQHYENSYKALMTAIPIPPKYRKLTSDQEAAMESTRPGSVGAYYEQTAAAQKTNVDMRRAAFVDLQQKRNNQVLQVRKQALSAGFQLQKEMMRARVSVDSPKAQISKIERNYKEALQNVSREPYVVGKKDFWALGFGKSTAWHGKKWEKENQPLVIDEKLLASSKPTAEWKGVIDASLALVNMWEYDSSATNEAYINLSMNYERAILRWQASVERGRRETPPLEMPNLDEADKFLFSGPGGF